MVGTGYDGVAVFQSNLQRTCKETLEQDRGVGLISGATPGAYDRIVYVFIHTQYMHKYVLSRPVGASNAPAKLSKLNIRHSLIQTFIGSGRY